MNGINKQMATKIERAFNVAHKKASAYVADNSRYLSHEYCMSADQLRQVENAWRQGFMAGVSFK